MSHLRIVSLGVFYLTDVILNLFLFENNSWDTVTMVTC